MSRARSRAIIAKATPVSETASQIADGLHDVADGLHVIAGVLAWCAAGTHSDTHGRQKEMAAVIMRFAKEGYFSTKVDGVKVSQADADQAETMFRKLFPSVGKRR